MVWEGIIDRLDLRVGNKLLIGAVGFLDSEVIRNLPGFGRFPGRDSGDRRPFACLHRRNDLGARNLRGP